MTEHQQLRLQKWRLKVLGEAEATGNVSKTCRHYGISREMFYRWRRRYQAQGITGLRDRTCAPHHSPKATPAEIVEKILYLRQHYHLGPWRIRLYELRYHEITIASQTIYKILSRHGLSRLPHDQAHLCRRQRWRRYEKPLRGHRLQIDTKLLAPIQGKRKSYWQFTAIHDCTRLCVLKIYERNTQKNAIDFVDYVLSRLPFRVQTIQTDNGSEFNTQFH